MFAPLHPPPTLFFLLFPFIHDPPPAAVAARRTSQSPRVQSMKWWHPRRTSKSPWQFEKRADSRKWLSQGRQWPIALDGCDTPGLFLKLPECQRRKGPRCQVGPFSRCSLSVIILRFVAALRIFLDPLQERGFYAAYKNTILVL